MPRIVERPPFFIHSPRNLAQALAHFIPNPQAQVYAGGTSWQQSSSLSGLSIPQNTLSLHLVDELRKVSFGERFFELGSTLTLNQILSIKDSAIPPLLKEAVRGIGSSALRNLATIGGNICAPDGPGDLFPVLYLLGAQFEVRSLRTSRWISAQEVLQENHLNLATGELLTKIRFPQENWPSHFYLKIGGIRTSWDERLAFTSLVRRRADSLEAIRLAFFLPQVGVLRSRDLEADLAGQRLPLSHSERMTALKLLTDGLNETPQMISSFQRHRIIDITRWFLNRLDDE